MRFYPHDSISDWLRDSDMMAVGVIVGWLIVGIEMVA
jgi:hypothetical protein